MKSTKTQKRYYSEVFKLSIIQEVIKGKLSKEQARKTYRIKGKSAILNWMRKYGFSSYPKQDIMPNDKKQAILDREKKLYSKIKELEAQLTQEKIRADGYSIMIDIAEKELKVPIRKKLPTKQ